MRTLPNPPLMYELIFKNKSIIIDHNRLLLLSTGFFSKDELTNPISHRITISMQKEELIELEQYWFIFCHFVSRSNEGHSQPKKLLFCEPYCAL